MNEESGQKARALSPSIITIVSITDYTILLGLLSRLRLEGPSFGVRLKQRQLPWWRRFTTLTVDAANAQLVRTEKLWRHWRKIRALSTRYCPYSLSVKGYNKYSFQVLSDENGKRKGIYSNPIIQKAVNKLWFNNKRDEGVIYQDYFNPISIPSIALILTAVGFFIFFSSDKLSIYFLHRSQIECNIDEWATGIKTDITFYAEEYRPIYDSHVVSLSEFGVYSKSRNLDLLGRLQRKLYNYGRWVFSFSFFVLMSNLSSEDYMPESPQ